MLVHPQLQPEPTAIPGIHHATWAGADEGLAQLSLWRQSIAPGGATPPHRHDCDEVVLCSGGRGELHLGGQVHAFGGGETVVVPRNALHQIFSTGETPLELIGVFGSAPVEVFLPDGERLPLPWRS
ncbi:cupin domain-containing protein [Ramlibacter rhizophilus]|uniref:Cupin domain-containing protein n=1 Tax=Ramlibacter rhizophilus TaxID=1781167 RepID=A0A4Z0BJK2_9BURK|nr:cupin domain-containing protein [Ramlibacter rhizophilus]TFY98583.1 cupin domain-containing protein [Ramlibacter rhizophilus]